VHLLTGCTASRKVRTALIRVEKLAAFFACSVSDFDTSFAAAASATAVADSFNIGFLLLFCYFNVLLNIPRSEVLNSIIQNLKVLLKI
jgi:hypothetical protein